MQRQWLRKYLPDQDTLNRFQLIRRFTPFLKRPELWVLKRNSIAGGLAVGLFSGMIPGPLQMLASVSLSIIFRVNLPVAILGTFFTNPFTILPLYMLAYMLGQVAIGELGASTMPVFPVSDWTQPLLAASVWLDWVLQFGQPLVIGLFILACLMGLAGYVLVQIGWRLHVLHSLRRRRISRFRLS